MRESMLVALKTVGYYASSDLSTIAQVASACSSVLDDPSLITPAAAQVAVQVVNLISHSSFIVILDQFKAINI